MDGAAQWVEMGLARARTGYLGTKSRGQVRPGYLLRYQFEFGRTFPRNCVANRLTQGPYGSGNTAIHITVMACTLTSQA